MVERGGDAARDVQAATSSRSGLTSVVGVTGAPGSGKSTLVDRIVTTARVAGDRVAVLAVDPSSPASGGAVLGDRIRMQGHATDPGVFVRSMATRGALGGLAAATGAAARVLEAASWPWVLVETVGVGQVEVDVAAVADTVVVVVTPGWGDDIQVAKAGLLEVADVFVVNKADRPGAEQARRDLEAMLDLSPAAAPVAPEGRSGPVAWRPPVVATVATTGQGVDDLWRILGDHRRFRSHSGG